MIGLNHGAVREIKDGRQDGGYFLSKMPVHLLKAAKTCFLFGFGLRLFLMKEIGLMTINLHFNALLG